MPVTIGVYLSNACPKSPNTFEFPALFNDLELIPGTLWNLPDLEEVSQLLQFWTCLTRAGGQDDVSSNQLPQSTPYNGIVIDSIVQWGTLPIVYK